MLNESYGVELSRCGEPLDSSPTEEGRKTPLSIFGIFVRNKKEKNFLNSVKQWIKFDNVFVVDPVGLARGLAVPMETRVEGEKSVFTKS